VYINSDFENGLWVITLKRFNDERKTPKYSARDKQKQKNHSVCNVVLCAQLLPSEPDGNIYTCNTLDNILDAEEKCSPGKLFGCGFFLLLL